MCHYQVRFICSHSLLNVKRSLFSCVSSSMLSFSSIKAVLKQYLYIFLLYKAVWIIQDVRQRQEVVLCANGSGSVRSYSTVLAGINDGKGTREQTQLVPLHLSVQLTENNVFHWCFSITLFSAHACA